VKEPVLQIRDVHKSFGDNVVLTGVSFDVNPAENVVVLGKSGTGKSVLIKIVVGLLEPDQGEVLAFGKNVHELDRKGLDEVRLRIGFAFQHAALYDSMSVRENLAFPVRMNEPDLPEAELNDRIEEVLEAVSLSKHIDHMPAELSGGQQKRIGVARTLMLRPDLMLYDEPTAGLDPKTAGDLNDLVNEVRERYGTACVLITHDLTCARATADRIAMLVDGKVHREGTFEEVFDTEDPAVRSFYDYNFVRPGDPT
jgi:phospholipid/cholesterol/gamma-HCH transport system ATP-binding protein